MKLNLEDVYSLASPPPVGVTVLLVFEDLKVLPARREPGWVSALTGSAQVGEPIGWTEVWPPLLEPHFNRVGRLACDEARACAVQTTR